MLTSIWAQALRDLRPGEAGDAGPTLWPSLPDTGAGLAAATHQPVLRTQRGREGQ